ncbi:MAG: prenyltransferase [Muribaculaceae bacterium]|nr:prenyltransferase [Muribaculaceae bacterium]
MNSLTRTLIKTSHPTSLILSVGAINAGLTASVIRGGITFLPALMTFLFAVLLQISGNLYHGYKYLSHHNNSKFDNNGKRTSRSENASRAILMKIVANAIAILALTTGDALFSFVGWLGLAYLVVIVTILFFYFDGPHPIVNTKWSLLVTFILFGPVAVSGTAIVQMPESTEWLPVVVYSLINGIMAVNAHISIQYLHYHEDKASGIETLVTAKGGSFARFIYLADAIIVSAILIIRPSAVEFVSPWVGIVLALILIISSIWVFTHMHRDPTNVSRLIRSVTLLQYVILILVLLCINLYAFDDFQINLIRLI